MLESISDHSKTLLLNRVNGLDSVSMDSKEIDEVGAHPQHDHIFFNAVC
jgi:hypothetical protein